jgi:hypothetical protein
MADQRTFELRPSAEAKEEDVLTAEQAAVSRLRPIQDGLDYWEEYGRCAAAVLGGPAPARLGQCSELIGWGCTRRVLIGPIMTRSMAGCKRDCMVRLHASPHSGISDGAEGTLHGSNPDQRARPTQLHPSMGASDAAE